VRFAAAWSRREILQAVGIVMPAKAWLRSTRALAVSQAVSGEWRSLFDGVSLDGWDETPFGGEGLIRVRDAAIVLEFGEPLTGITRHGDVARMDYEIRLDAQRLAGHDFFCGLTFPVAASACSLILGGWGGSLVGLSNLDGKDASENETTQRIPFDDGRWYGVRVRVTASRIQAWLDDGLIIDVSTTGRRIGVRPEVDASRPLGVASYRTRAALRGIRTRSIAPEA
jgi:hypothetical protein